MVNEPGTTPGTTRARKVPGQSANRPTKAAAGAANPTKAAAGAANPTKAVAGAANPTTKATKAAANRTTAAAAGAANRAFRAAPPAASTTNATTNATTATAEPPAPGKALARVGTASPRQHPPGRAAAATVQRREHVTLALPLLGRVQLPHPQNMAYYAGLGALAALELVEWPAAVALAVGHALTSQRHNRALDEFGEALEDA